ncbi:MAG: tRNA (adenosine(37)-N6)-threonylcarbamoyltransferase complex dimerization subunit type 1 TsaB [Alicyclobacillaceae bacterium]|nr:tRNA (adenosine(37)-N6)-threonylcarbamoyltransferase complex dimerization subunit type 1 TsaB [Alicyclobacillaceae bacterium]
MVTLVMDTATEVIAAGVVVEDRLVSSCTSRVARLHSRFLAPMLDSALAVSGANRKQIEQLVVGVGPGSYTGVRIAVSTAKAMATALDIPLRPVSTLSALAAAAMAALAPATGEDVHLTCLLAARRSRAYGARYQGSHRQPSLRTLSLGAVRSYSEWQTVVLEDVEKYPTARHLVVYDEPMQPFSSAGTRLQWLPLGQLMGQLPLGLWNAAREVTPVCGAEIHSLVPAYLLEVEAETRLRQKGSMPDAE